MDEFPTKITLLDLSSQIPFEMDDAIKKELCFGESLIVSCGHYDGAIGQESSESEWSCHDTTDSESSEEIKDDKIFEVKDRVEEESVAEKVMEEDNDFFFYFFPDCNKPVPPQDSKASLLIVNGLPQINPAVKGPELCTCDVNNKGKCECFTKLPCHCGAKTQDECTCAQLENICICNEGKPAVTCNCKNCNICLCYPHGMRPICTCNKIEKPCVCPPSKFPFPVCSCKYKPTFIEGLNSIGEEGEFNMDCEESKDEQQYQKQFKEQQQEPCECQKVEPKPHCLCLKGKECNCNVDSCICGVRKTCICEPIENEETLCKSEESKTICSCSKRQECSCEGERNDCKCFPKQNCSCGNPDDCKCFSVCNCTLPCICGTSVEEPPECICMSKLKQPVSGLTCTCVKCKEEEKKKLKRVKAGKHGYRWCPDIDPRHTYFDYGYDRHDKISYKEKEREKVKILGLNEDKKVDEICTKHGFEAPPYEKKVRKQSIDCCSSVGGISICVATLGEDKDKFLVQVISHSSKEGAKTGSKLVSILDCNLHTMEENRSEHIIKKDFTKERRSYIAICDSGYYNKVTRICGDRHVVKRHYYNFNDARNFLLEGANVVLLRYFGLRRHRGNVKTDTVMMNGLICESVYVCHGVSQAIVNGKPMFVVKVERHIIEPSGYIHQTLTVLTLRGYMVSHEWADNCYMFHINPLLGIVPEKDHIESHAPLREKWRDDLQLLSDYLDFKSKRTSEGGRYLTESGALTGTIRDYLQALLLLRPHDALHFTRHYFGSALSALDLPHDEYFDPTSKHVRYFFFEE